MDENDNPASEDEAPVTPSDERSRRNAEWVRQVFAENPSLPAFYGEARAELPHLFEGRELAEIVSHVERLVAHFEKDGLTRLDCFEAFAAQPQLLLRKPDQMIDDVEKVLGHFHADPIARAAYLLSLVEHPVLFRACPSAMIASIETLNAVGPNIPQPTVSLPASDIATCELEPLGCYYPELATPAELAERQPATTETPGTRVDRPLILQLERALGHEGRAA